MEKNFKIKEIICVGVLLSFIIVLFVINSSGTDKSVKEITVPTLKAMSNDGLSAASKAAALKEFKFEKADIDEISYYSDTDIMDVTELLIVKVKDRESMPKVKQAVEKRLEEQKNLYKSYAPEQYALLNTSIIKTNGNILFYCVSENVADALASYKKAL